MKLLILPPLPLASMVTICADNDPTGIAAALSYDYPDDSQAAELSQDLKQKGLDKVLEEVCGLASDSDLANHIKEKSQHA